MGFLDDIADLREGEGLVHLSKVTLIGEDLASDQIWATLLDDYRKVQTPEKACSISILNAALTHGRRIFALTRDGVEKMVRNDPNWLNPPTFNTKNWSKYLLFMHEREMILKVFEGHVSIYELTFRPLLNRIPENIRHKEQAIDFAERKKKNGSRDFGKSQHRDTSAGDTERKYKVFVPTPEDLAATAHMFKSEYTDDDICGPEDN